jgi:tyrosyl-DNA phosphodiesterase 2
LLALLEERRPDVIALQEVTLPFLAGIRATPWIQREYFVSDFMGSTVQSYGVALLSRFPFESLESHTLTSRMDRTLLLAHIPVNGTRLAVGTMHLESLDSAAIRASQLEQVFKTVAQDRDALLMGDFNFCSSWPEEQSRIPAAYADAWSTLRAEPGYTEDPAVNRMLRKMKKEREAVRFDRILLRSEKPGWVPVSVELLGTKPVSEDLPDVFPSDHFGLFARMQWRE